VNDRYTRALLSEINRWPCWLQIIFSYFVFSSKIHKRWLISWIHCTLREFSNKFLKQQKHLIFCLDHVSLYSESAAWLPDPSMFSWIRRESLSPVHHRVVSYLIRHLRQQVSSKIVQEMRSRVQCETIFCGTKTSLLPSQQLFDRRVQRVWLGPAVFLPTI